MRLSDFLVQQVNDVKITVNSAVLGDFWDYAAPPRVVYIIYTLYTN